jgi:hypothetical protein
MQRDPEIIFNIGEAITKNNDDVSRYETDLLTQLLGITKDLDVSNEMSRLQGITIIEGKI